MCNRTKEELEASVAEYIEFYNEGRPHRKLNMKTPAQFEAAYFSALNAKQKTNDRILNYTQKSSKHQPYN